MNQVYSIDCLPPRMPIGYVGENDFRSVLVNVEAWLRAYPDGVISAVYMRPGGQIYAVALSRSGNIIGWRPTAKDLTAKGEGVIRFEIRSGSVAKQSAKMILCVEKAAEPDDAAIAPSSDWLEQALGDAATILTEGAGATGGLEAVVQAAQTAAQTAMASAEKAQESIEITPASKADQLAEMVRRFNLDAEQLVNFVEAMLEANEISKGTTNNTDGRVSQAVKRLKDVVYAYRTTQGNFKSAKEGLIYIQKNGELEKLVVPEEYLTDMDTCQSYLNSLNTTLFFMSNKYFRFRHEKEYDFSDKYTREQVNRKDSVNAGM